MRKRKIMLEDDGEFTDMLEADGEYTNDEYEIDERKRKPRRGNTSIIVALIGAAAVIIAAFIGLARVTDNWTIICSVFDSVIHDSPRCENNTNVLGPTQTAMVQMLTALATFFMTSDPSASAPSTNIPTLTTTIMPPPPETRRGFDFETGTQNWNTSEGAY